MEKYNKSSSKAGLGFLGVLTILFIALKLTGKITWSWWLVWLPIWILPAVFIVGGSIATIVMVLSKKNKKGNT